MKRRTSTPIYRHNPLKEIENDQNSRRKTFSFHITLMRPAILGSVRPPMPPQRFSQFKRHSLSGKHRECHGKSTKSHENH